MPTPLNKVIKYDTIIKIPTDKNNFILFDNQNLYIKLRKTNSDNEIKKCNRKYIYSLPISK